MQRNKFTEYMHSNMRSIQLRVCMDLCTCFPSTHFTLNGLRDGDQLLMIRQLLLVFFSIYHPQKSQIK